jgi:GNAT superfamily N-acetyltransferase
VDRTLQYLNPMSLDHQSNVATPRSSLEHADCSEEGAHPRRERFVDSTGRMLQVTPYDETHFETLVDFYEQYPQRHRSMSLPPLARAQIELWIEKLTHRGQNILTFDGERVIGHVAYSPREGFEPELVVFVDDEYHGRGVGTELCKQAIACAAADGHDSMKLHVHSANGGAIHVYESLGFDTVDRNDDTLLMCLEIDESVRDDVCEQ